jgi:hypothetical protein
MSVQEPKALARKHWDKWLPEKVGLLKREGRLNEELQAAATRLERPDDRCSGKLRIVSQFMKARNAREALTADRGLA